MVTLRFLWIVLMFGASSTMSNFIANGWPLSSLPTPVRKLLARKPNSV